VPSRLVLVRPVETVPSRLVLVRLVMVRPVETVPLRLLPVLVEMRPVEKRLVKKRPEPV